MSEEKYWFQDLNIIFDKHKIQEVYPKKEMTHADKVNSLVRLSLILGILLSMFNGNSNWLIIPVGFMLITYLMYLFRIDEVKKEVKKIGPSATTKDLPPDIKEKFQSVIKNDNCETTTVDNPFMNAMPFDNRKRSSACNVLKKMSQMEIEDNYNANIFMDTSDIFGKNNGQRQFYTTPSTTYPNNQTSFAKWLYGTPPTCKEGNGAQCVGNLYHPLTRRMHNPGHGSTN